MNWRSWRVIDGSRRFQARERSHARTMRITASPMNNGARIQGLDVNQGNQLNGAHVCSCSTNSVSPSTGITWIDGEAVEEDVHLERADLARADAVLGGVVGRLREPAVRAEERPDLVDVLGLRLRPVVLEAVAGRLAGGSAPRRRLGDGRAGPLEDGGDCGVGLGRGGGGGRRGRLGRLLVVVLGRVVAGGQSGRRQQRAGRR